MTRSPNVIVATSSDQAIVPNANIVAGAPVRRALAIAGGERARDGDDHRARDRRRHRLHRADVHARGDARRRSAVDLAHHRSDLGGGWRSIGPLAFTVTDNDGFGDHTVTVFSSNPALVPNTSAHLTLGGAAGARTLTITPAPDQHGTATISVRVFGQDDAGGDVVQRR